MDECILPGISCAPPTQHTWTRVQVNICQYQKERPGQTGQTDAVSSQFLWQGWVLHFFTSVVLSIGPMTCPI